MTERYDVVVAGLGAMGSAAAAELAARGVRVLGLDRFDPPHALGSSHGETRIIREAYFEHPQYVPLVQRSYERWAALEAETGATLYRRTGGLMIGPDAGAVIAGTRASVVTHRLAHDRLSAREIQQAYPVFRLPGDWVGLREPRAGVLLPERCIAAHLERGRKHGAALRPVTPVTAWSAGDGGVTVTTPQGTILAGHLVLTVGAWLASLVTDLALPLTVERTVLHWFEPAADPAAFEADRFPIFLIEFEPGRMVYGIPAVDAAGPGVKVALHHLGSPADPDHVRREVDAAEVEAVRPLLRQYLPALDGRLLRSAVCLYTNTPDFDFLIDWHPLHREVLLVSPCSGHGFKFASALGEVVADLVLDGRSRFDLSPFRANRWPPGAPSPSPDARSPAPGA